MDPTSPYLQASVLAEEQARQWHRAGLYRLSDGLQEVASLLVQLHYLAPVDRRKVKRLVNELEQKM